MEKTFKIGEWVYDPETLVVRYGDYEVDLEQCSTSAQMLCQIWQFADNSSATNESLGDLILILKWLLDPEANLICRGKKEKPLPNGEALRKLIAEHIRDSFVSFAICAADFPSRSNLRARARSRFLLWLLYGPNLGLIYLLQ
jgi:hypothetical protein